MDEGVCVRLTTRIKSVHDTNVLIVTEYDITLQQIILRDRIRYISEYAVKQSGQKHRNLGAWYFKAYLDLKKIAQI